MSTHDAAENNFKKTYRTYRNTKNNTIGKKLQIKTDSSRLFRPCKHSTSQSHSRIASKSGLWLHFNVFRRLNLVFDKTLMMQCCHFSAKLSHLGGCKCVRMQNQTWILLHPVFAHSELDSMFNVWILYKKAVLSQRWARDAQYISLWVPLMSLQSSQSRTRVKLNSTHWTLNVRVVGVWQWKMRKKLGE